jgi:hypothetical protein
MRGYITSSTGDEKKKEKMSRGVIRLYIVVGEKDTVHHHIHTSHITIFISSPMINDTSS